MPIEGLTDKKSIVARFTRLGKLHKGGERINTGRKDKFGRPVYTVGPDLDYFRFVPDKERPDKSEMMEVFKAEIGEQPRQLLVYMPYKDVETCFESWSEIWDATGLVHRCDGKTATVWREGDKIVRGEKPCPGGHTDDDYKKDSVGRLYVLIPELVKAGFRGIVTLGTHGKNDCANIAGALQAAFDMTVVQNRPMGLMGMSFILRRSQETVGIPGFGDKKGQRAKAQKWLVRLEQTTDTALAMLEAARQFTLSLPSPTSAKVEDEEEGVFEPMTVEPPQNDGTIALIDEIRSFGVELSVENGMLKLVNGNKLSPEQIKKINDNRAEIIATILANGASIPSSPKTECDMEWCEWCGQVPSPKGVPCSSCEKLGAVKGEPPVGNDKKETDKARQERKNVGQANHKATQRKTLSPMELKGMIGRKAENINERGQKCTLTQRSQLAAGLESVFPDLESSKREEKRHRVCEFLTGFSSLSEKAERKMPDWYVLALHAWLYHNANTIYDLDTKKYNVEEVAGKEAIEVEHYVLLESEKSSAPESFDVLCLTANYDEQAVREWFGANGWDVADPKAEAGMREIIGIAKSQGLDLLKDETIRMLALEKAIEIWPVAK